MFSCFICCFFSSETDRPLDWSSEMPPNLDIGAIATLAHFDETNTASHTPMT